VLNVLCWGDVIEASSFEAIATSDASGLMKTGLFGLDSSSSFSCDFLVFLEFYFPG